MESGENSDAARVKEEYDEMVMLRVQHQGQPDFCFTMKRAEPLRKLMIKFCERVKLGDYREVRFTVDGSRVRGDQTPNELELENDDVIDAWSEQLGAGGTTAANLVFQISYLVQISTKQQFHVFGLSNQE